MTFRNQSVSPSCSRAKKTPVLPTRYPKSMFPAVPPVTYRYNEFWDFDSSHITSRFTVLFDAPLNESVHVISKG